MNVTWVSNITCVSKGRIIILNKKKEVKTNLWGIKNSGYHFEHVHDDGSSYYSVRIILIDKCEREFDTICILNEESSKTPQYGPSKCSSASFIDSYDKINHKGKYNHKL